MQVVKWISTAKSLGSRYVNAFDNLLHRISVTPDKIMIILLWVCPERGMGVTSHVSTWSDFSKKMNKSKISCCLYVTVSQDASPRLMTADIFCSISSHPQRPCIFTVLAQMQILSQLTWQATQQCCLCSEVTNDPSSSLEGPCCTVLH